MNVQKFFPMFFLIIVSIKIAASRPTAMKVVATNSVAGSPPTPDGSGVVNHVSEVMKVLLTQIEDVDKEEIRLENERKSLEFFYNQFGQIIVNSRPRYG